MAKKRKQGHPPNGPASTDPQNPTDQSTIRPSPGTGGAFWKASTPPGPGLPTPAGRHVPPPDPTPLTRRSLASDSASTAGRTRGTSVEQRGASRTTGHPPESLSGLRAKTPKGARPLAGSSPSSPDQRTSATPTRALSGIKDGSNKRRPLLARSGQSSGTVVTSLSCGPIGDMQPQSLGVTYWFDTEPSGDPYTVDVYLEGRRQGTDRKRPADFTTLTKVAPVVPGTGPISVTTRITDAEEGTWDVQAWPVTLVSDEPTQQWTVHEDPLLPVSSVSGRTLYAPVTLVLAPGVVMGAWPALVSLGALLGVGVQAFLAGRLGLPVGRVALLTLIACLLGLLGAKTYYLSTHPHERKRILTVGMSVQGFVITVGLTLLLGSWALGIPTGPLLDVTGPALLLGMAVGRLGCLLGGCCVGRPTRSRWGVWSSNRRIGVRRIPVQLLESATALLICVAAVSTVLTIGVSGGGLVFLASLATYTTGRQLLFPLRELPRTTTYGRQVMLVTSLVVAFAAAGVLLVR